ncbi:LysM peptidoglycan-binding domain-containing protein [Pyxidicoccus xibeiensis]|uniref:LysM peptidoglycan-binding domain-containing protein n=1 Tax=Pyxidicoccus xibeiensis TaxID=2906759 RepID=UPI0020A7D8D8|nr:LysM peptidoglycan-binding domain-containing protein [Pyxidicoccus xibeiensis]MCP3142903.1 LysM domain-containing protein [Pyxidicoccus xibeiensis]
MSLLRFRLRDGHREYLILEAHEPFPEGHEDVSAGRGWWLERHLHQLSRDEGNLRTLRNVLYAHGHLASFGPLSTEQVARQAAALFSLGSLRLARAPLPLSTQAPAFPEALLAVAPPPTQEEPRWLKVQVLDDVSGAPVAGLKLRILLSDDSEKQATTDSDGLIELKGIPPGHATVSSDLEGATLAETLALVKVEGLPPPRDEEAEAGDAGSKPRFLARLIEHRVRDGETLESVAERYETTVDALGQFNWSTTEPAQIQRHLYLDVGCTVRKGGKFVFTRRDSPGILFVPQPLSLRRLAVERHHTLRVKQAYEPRGYLFSA